MPGITIYHIIKYVFFNSMHCFASFYIIHNAQIQPVNNMPMFVPCFILDRCRGWSSHQKEFKAGFFHFPKGQFYFIRFMVRWIESIVLAEQFTNGLHPFHFFHC
jgi:hypothetical protein